MSITCCVCGADVRNSRGEFIEGAIGGGPARPFCGDPCINAELGGYTGVMNRGKELRRMNRWDQALCCFQRAQAIRRGTSFPCHAAPLIAECRRHIELQAQAWPAKTAANLLLRAGVSRAMAALRIVIDDPTPSEFADELAQIILAAVDDEVDDRGVGVPRDVQRVLTALFCRNSQEIEDRVLQLERKKPGPALAGARIEADLAVLESNEASSAKLALRECYRLASAVKHDGVPVDSRISRIVTAIISIVDAHARATVSEVEGDQVAAGLETACRNLLAAIEAGDEAQDSDTSFGEALEPHIDAIRDILERADAAAFARSGGVETLAMQAAEQAAHPATRLEDPRSKGVSL